MEGLRKGAGDVRSYAPPIGRRKRGAEPPR